VLRNGNSLFFFFPLTHAPRSLPTPGMADFTRPMTHVHFSTPA
jgi:hypothetical protein